MDVEVQITVDIIEIEEMIQKVIDNHYPHCLIKSYQQMISNKQGELKML